MFSGKLFTSFLCAYYCIYSIYIWARCANDDEKRNIRERLDGIKEAHMVSQCLQIESGTTTLTQLQPHLALLNELDGTCFSHQIYMYTTLKNSQIIDSKV